MRKTKKHPFQTLKENYPKERNQEELLAVLNGDLTYARVPRLDPNFNPRFQDYDESARKRLVALVDAIRLCLIAIAKPVPVDHRVAFDDYVARAEMLRPINAAFRRCRIIPMLLLDMIDRRTLIVREEVKEDLHNQAEAYAMLALRDLLSNGEMDSLRQCSEARCVRWFMAKRTKQRWCSQACRQKNFQATDSFRASRRRTYQSKKQLLAGKMAKGELIAKTAK